MPTSSVASKKLIFRTIPANPSLLPNQRPQTTQLNSNLTGHKNPRIEIQAKFNLSMVLWKERKIIPTIPIDMIGIKGYDKRKSREAGA